MTKFTKAPCDIFIICALHSIELEAVKEICEHWEREPQNEDPHTYERAIFLSGSRELSLVIAAPAQMGMSASAVLTTKAISRFQPRLVVMLGIAAGVKKDSQNFGDVVIAEHTYDYGAGKLSDNKGLLEFAPDFKPIEMHTRLITIAKRWKTKKEEIKKIKEDWNKKQANNPLAPKITNELSIHVGPLASGAAVVNTSSVAEEQFKHWRKLVGTEMEAYAVHRACQDTVEPPIPFLCIKSICDFADGNKNDHYQEYAAYTSAQFFKMLLEKEEGLIFIENF